MELWAISLAFGPLGHMGAIYRVKHGNAPGAPPMTMLWVDVRMSQIVLRRT